MRFSVGQLCLSAAIIVLFSAGCSQPSPASNAATTSNSQPGSSLVTTGERLTPDDIVALNQQGRDLISNGRYRDAEGIFRRALTAAESSLDSDDLALADAEIGLAEVYENTGRPKEGEDLARRSLAIKEKVLGPDHLDVATVLNRLGRDVLMQNRLIEAEQIYGRALTIRTKALGPSDPLIAQSLNNMGVVSDDLRNFDQAERWYRLSLNIREEALGHNHPDTVKVVGNLGTLYVEEGKYSEAELLLKWALDASLANTAIQKIEGGRDKSGLAVVDANHGKFNDAEQEGLDGLSLAEKTFGQVSADYAYALGSLGQVYEAESKFSDSDRYYRQQLAVEKKILGDYGPSPVSLERYASMLKKANRPADAQAVLAQELVVRQHNCEQELKQKCEFENGN